MNWIIEKNNENETVNSLSRDLNVSPVISLMLVNRGIKNFDQAKDFFRPNLSQLHDPFLMKDMNIAVNKILGVIEKKEPIMIFGDYDVDGTSAVALLSTYLKEIGANISTYIPDRNKEGYGVSISAIDLASKNNIGLIIALDCGIKANSQIEYALKKDIDFIICDHHNPSEVIPKALAVLNPKRLDCNYPFKDLCGCGVGFKLIQAINFKKGEKTENIVNYLDLVALAIAADIVPIVGENRILAHIGIQIVNSNPRMGIHAILKNNVKKEFTIRDLLFYVAPRINASGRIAHGSLSVELLSEKQFEKAEKLFKKIDQLNTQRREIEKNITKEALMQIEESNNKNKNSTVVYKKSWNKGVIGIVASKLIEKHYKPTIVFCKSEDGNLTASARSIKKVDLYKILERCSDYIIQFGGHKYAAGLIIKEENYDLFKECFEKAVSSILKEKIPEQEVPIESEIELDSITPKFFRILNQFEPYGPGNKTPIFMSRELSLDGALNKVGKNKEHLKISIKQKSKISFPAIGFWMSDKFDRVNTKAPFSMAYSIDQNTWNGKIGIQLKIKDIK
tara:strand:+ start:960 stop:2651 length:1692 start_codon:yes stop_codon:yes gene_type:complete